MPRSSRLRCEILSPLATEAADLVAIARICARDLGQPIRVTTRPVSASRRESLITLHLPAELAAGQHQVWCLACRLACFCPHARVSVLVLGAGHFAGEATPGQSVSRHPSAA